MTTPVGLNDQELAVFNAIHEARGRVITRTELAKAAGLQPAQGRRVDVMLVNVRRAIPGEELLNIRSRGWMLPSSHLTA